MFVPDSHTSIHIREYRQAQGRSLRMLAEAAACSEAYVYRAEVQKGDLSVYVVPRLADILQVAPHLLVQYAGWPCTCACHAREP